MKTIPYQRLHPEELADLEAKYGRELDEREALHLLRQERERSMREQLYGSRGSEPLSRRAHNPESLVELQAPLPVSKVTAEQLVAAETAPCWRVPALILLALILGEAWLAAHYMNVIESFFR